MFLYEEHEESIMGRKALCVVQASASSPNTLCRPWERSITPLPQGKGPRFYLKCCIYVQKAWGSLEMGHREETPIIIKGGVPTAEPHSLGILAKLRVSFGQR